MSPSSSHTFFFFPRIFLNSASMHLHCAFPQTFRPAIVRSSAVQSGKSFCHCSRRVRILTPLQQLTDHDSFLPESKVPAFVQRFKPTQPCLPTCRPTNSIIPCTGLNGTNWNLANGLQDSGERPKGIRYAGNRSALKLKSNIYSQIL